MTNNFYRPIIFTNSSLFCLTSFSVTHQSKASVFRKLLSPSQLGNALTTGGITPNGDVYFDLSNLMALIFNRCTDVELQSLTWSIQGNTYTGVSVSHNIGCADGTGVNGTISFGNCSASFTYETPTTCPVADCTQDWEETQYNGGNRKICYRTKTKSKYQDYLGVFGSNKIEAKMRNYKKKSNGKWKKQKADLGIDADGTLAYNLSCNCDGDFTVNESESKNNKKSITLKETYNNYSEIHMHDNYKWFADFKVNGSTIMNNWDASANCN